jgi:hypothetical protein
MTIFKKSLLAIALCTWIAASAVAQTAAPGAAAVTSAGPDADAKKDMARHRAIAAAHEAAAKCLETGKKEEVCHKELQTACKGLAIGKYCGMKHEH